MSKSETLTVGTCGLSFYSTNFGCSALAFAFTKLLSEAGIENDISIKLVIFTSDHLNGKMPASHFFTDIRIVPYSSSRPTSLAEVCKWMKECDLIFDFTLGDSFSDYYGARRFYTGTLLKYMANRLSGGLVLGPQTFGPFIRPFVKKAAKSVIMASKSVYARDEESAEVVRQLGRKDVVSVTDVAFYLPAAESPSYDDGHLRFGLNVSGLLWQDSFKNESSFGLTVNYRDYILALIPRLLDFGYEIHLIPHVFEGQSAPESDYLVCKEISSLFPGTVLPDPFETPMSAKGYIQTMDVFSGARMHATIAAFSSGIATIPFSYSRKFEGLYGTLGYRYCIDGRRLTTDEAVETTLEFARNPSLAACVEQAHSIISGKLQHFKELLGRELLEASIR